MTKIEETKPGEFPRERDDLPHVYIDDVLMTLKYFVDEAVPHLLIKDPEVCRRCVGKPCLFFCPVGAYRLKEDCGEVQIAFQSCIECGSCRIACPPNNVSWKYPRGGFGVAYKYG
jgi:ferredoxin like protein